MAGASEPEWPIIGSKTWFDEVYIETEAWEALTDDERSRVEAWMKSQGREIRETYVNGDTRLMHYPKSSPLKLSPEVGPIELWSYSKSVRHAKEVCVMVQGAESGDDAKIIFLEWMEDVIRDIRNGQDEMA